MHRPYLCIYLENEFLLLDFYFYLLYNYWLYGYTQHIIFPQIIQIIKISIIFELPMQLLHNNRFVPCQKHAFCPHILPITKCSLWQQKLYIVGSINGRPVFDCCYFTCIALHAFNVFWSNIIWTRKFCQICLTLFVVVKIEIIIIPYFHFVAFIIH